VDAGAPGAGFQIAEAMLRNETTRFNVNPPGFREPGFREKVSSASLC
jgi:hypothetical protein